MARPPADTKETKREIALFRAEKLNELGNVEWSQSHYSEAQKCYQEALHIFRAHGDRSGECKALGALGTAFQRQGLFDQAIDCHTAGDAPGASTALEQAKAIAHELGLSDESEVKQRIADLTALLG